MINEFIPPASKINADYLVEKCSKEISGLNKELDRRFKRFVKSNPEQRTEMNYHEVAEGMKIQKATLKEKIIFYKNYYN